MLYVRYTHHLVQTSQHAPVLPSCTTHTRNRPREAGRLREDGGRKRRSRDSTPGPLFQSHARPLRTGQREQEPSLTGRDTGTRSHLPLMVRRLKQRQTPLCPLCRETQISSDSPDQSPRDTASPVTRPPPTAPRSHPITPDTITMAPAPHWPTATCAVYSHTVPQKRRCPSRSHGPGTPEPSPQARLSFAACPPWSPPVLRCPYTPALLCPQGISPHTSFLHSLVVGERCTLKSCYVRRVL